MVFCIPWMIPLLGLLVLRMLSSASRTAMRRTDNAAAELAEDVKVLASRHSADRIPVVLEAQGTPFARALHAALTLPGCTGRTLIPQVEERLQEILTRPTSAERLAGEIAGLIVAYVGLVVVLASYKGGLGSDPGTCLILGFAISFPLLIAYLAVRSTLALDRERRDLLERHRTLILDTLVSVAAIEEAARGGAGRATGGDSPAGTDGVAADAPRPC